MTTTASDEVVLDNKDCRFEPHVAVVRTSQKLALKNSDPVGHNSKIDPLDQRGHQSDPGRPAASRSFTSSAPKRRCR